VAAETISNYFQNGRFNSAISTMKVTPWKIAGQDSSLGDLNSTGGS
jgi:hypothetical protein